VWTRERRGKKLAREGRGGEGRGGGFMRGVLLVDTGGRE